MPKLRWDCGAQGCFNVKQRPKIEIFDDCFAGRNALGDIDGAIERNGRFLYLEWKREPEIGVAQDIAFRHRTTDGLSVAMTVAADAETMEVTHMGRYANGRFSGWTPANLEEVKNKLREWEKWALAQPKRELP